MINAECAIKAIPDEDDRNFTRLNMSKKLKKILTNDLSYNSTNLSRTHNEETRLLQTIKEKLTSHEAILCKADKETPP